MGNKQRSNWRTFWSAASAIGSIWTLGLSLAALNAWGVGKYLINAMLPMLPGKGPDSPAYSWKHEPNLPANADIPMPIVYGKTRVKPVIKSRHVRMDGTKQYLDVLYSFTGHRVDERTVGEWNRRKVYFRDISEVTMPAYPGRTYKCIRSHVDAHNPLEENSRYWKLSHGTAWDAGISDITIDNNPIESYVTAAPDIFTFETRAGAAQQAFIEGFETSYDNYPQGVVINTPEPTIAFDTASIVLKELETGGHQYWIEWQEHDLLYFGAYHKIEKGETTWAIFPEVTPETPLCVLWVLGASKYTLRSIKPTEIPNGYHLVTYFTRLVPAASTKKYIIDDFKTSSIVLSNIHNIELVFYFPRGLYSFSWKQQETKNDTATIKAQYRESGTTKWNPFEQTLNWKETGVKTTYSLDNGLSISANKTESFSVSWSAKNEGVYLDATKSYEVQYEAISAQIVEIANVAGVTYSLPDSDGEYRPHTFPGECLLGIRAMATGYLQGGFEVTAAIERSEVKVMDDTGSWVDKDANCHAWAVYDMLVNGWISHPQYPNMTNEASEIMPVYGCGIDPDRIDYDSFIGWETHTFTFLEFRLNTVFDTTMTIWDAISRICEEGLASIIPIGSEFRALVDRQALDTEINSLFCMGNINEGTFQQSWVDQSKKARSIEASFANADRTPAYTESKFTARIPEWDTADEQDSPLSMTLYGTTDYIQALAIAQYRLNCNFLLSQTIAFETDVEAMELEVGDVIPVQHDTICGDGGRLVDVAYNLLVNPSFESGLAGWTKWGRQSWWSSSAQAKYGSLSLRTVSAVDNGGGQQSFTVKPSTEYTLSCWIYVVPTAVPLATYTIRAMTLATGSPYSKANIDKTLVLQWQQVSVAFTTAATQTTATVWLGGIGEAYFDGVMVSPGTTIPTFMLNGLVTLTLDKAMTTVPLPTQYELQMACKDGGIEVKKGITSGNVSADGTVLTFGTDWDWSDYLPEVYDPYAFGIKDATVKLFRIMSLSANSDYRFEIVAMEYDEDVYRLNAADSDSEIAVLNKIALIAPDLNEPAVVTFPRATSVTLQEVVSLNRTTGQYESSIVVKFSPPPDAQNGEYEVSWRDVDADEGDVEGVWDSGDSYDINSIVENDGIVYISDKSGNTSEPFLIN